MIGERGKLGSRDGNTFWNNVKQMKDYLGRIKFKGDLKNIFLDVCRDYKIGNYKSYSVVKVGY